MATTRRTKTPAASIYNSKEEVDNAIAHIAQLQRTRTRISTTLDRRITRLNEKAKLELEPIIADLNATVKEVVLYAEQNRSELTNDGSTKTVKFTHGVVKWKLTPPAVTIKNVKAVMAALKRLELSQFIRVKETPNKQAMVGDKELAVTLDGVSITQYEQLVITPTKTQLDIPIKLKAVSSDSSVSD